MQLDTGHVIALAGIQVAIAQLGIQSLFSDIRTGIDYQIRKDVHPNAWHAFQLATRPTNAFITGVITMAPLAFIAILLSLLRHVDLISKSTDVHLRFLVDQGPLYCVLITSTLLFAFFNRLVMNLSFRDLLVKVFIRLAGD